MTVAEQILRAKDDYDAVYDAGKKAEYDAFWDAYQNNGNKTNYNTAFGGSGWTDTSFKPKHKLRVTNAQNMFNACHVTDYVEATKHIGGIDFTACTSFNYTWQSSFAKKLGIIDCSSTKALTSTFSASFQLKTIEKLIVTAENTFPSTFYGCKALENITFEGTIANDISFANSPNLTIDSMWNIVSSLADFSATDTGTEMGKYAHTITFSNEAWNRLMQDSATPWGILDSRKWNLTTV